MSSYEDLRDTALDKLKNYMDALDPDKGKKLAYWVNDYVNFLNSEATFSPNKLIRYKRGSIVKVHLGYRIGSEEGGLHYAIVMDRQNSIHSPTITVIPLTSIKPGVDLEKLPLHKVSIGNEVYTLLNANLDAELRVAKRELAELKAFLDNTERAPTAEQETAFYAKLAEINRHISYCKKMKAEIQKMKQGSIALVGQITTVSKIRIYDPRYNNDALSKVRVSPKTLDVLDARIQELYGAPQQSKTESV